jgi:hypothetical protein
MDSWLEYRACATPSEGLRTGAQSGGTAFAIIPAMSSVNPFRHEPNWGDWILAGLIGGAAIGALLWGLSHAGSHGDLRHAFPDAEPAPGRPAPPPASAAPTPRSAVSTAPVPAGGKVVYACTVNGRRVYSDGACGPDARAQDLRPDALNLYTPPAVDTTPVGVSSSVVESPAVFVRVERPGTETNNDAACAAIQREIDGIDARMRSAYRSEEGERLRARRHEAKERFHDFGCRWHTPK